jgi:NAD-dependent SIR2 family protein deacetylase
MENLYYVVCAACRWRYYVDNSMLTIPNFPTVCPKCHHERPVADALREQGVQLARELGG